MRNDGNDLLKEYRYRTTLPQNLAAGTILRLEEVEKIRGAQALYERAEALVTEAQKLRLCAQEEAKFLLAEQLSVQKRLLARKVQEHYLAEQTRAQQSFKITLVELQAEIYNTVAHIIKKILGDMPEQERTLKLVTEAIRRADIANDARVVCASNVADDIRRVVESLCAETEQALQISTDSTLENGRVILVTKRGYLEIGIDAILRDIADRDLISVQDMYDNVSSA